MLAHVTMFAEVTYGYTGTVHCPLLYVYEHCTYTTVRVLTVHEHFNYKATVHTCLYMKKNRQIVKNTKLHDIYTYTVLYTYICNTQM